MTNDADRAIKIFWDVDTRRWQRGDWILFGVCEALLIAFALACFTVDDLSATLGPLEWQAVVLAVFWIVGTMLYTILRKYTGLP